MKKRIGLALSGGAARGFAHIGVLEALNEFSIYPDMIAGTSAGSVIGALYADGHNSKEILKIFNKIKLYDLIDVAWPRGGLLKMTKLEKLLHNNLRAKKFSDLKLPLIVNAVNLNTGENVFFNKGELIPKLLASCALPFIYRPVSIGHHQFVDGGVLINLPTDPLVNKCDFTIGVNLNPTSQKSDFSSVFSVAIRTYYLSIRSSVKERMKDCDIVIEPWPLESISHFDVSQGHEMYKIGYSTTKELLNKPKNKKKLFELIS